MEGGIDGLDGRSDTGSGISKQVKSYSDLEKQSLFIDLQLR